MRTYTHRHFYSAALALAGVLALMKCPRLIDSYGIALYENDPANIAGFALQFLPVTTRPEPDSLIPSRILAGPRRTPARPDQAIPLKLFPTGSTF